MLHKVHLDLAKLALWQKLVTSAAAKSYPSCNDLHKTCALPWKSRLHLPQWLCVHDSTMWISIMSSKNTANALQNA